MEKKTTSNVYLSLGSNLGHKRKNIITALCLLAERAGDIPALSSFHETKPWGFDSPNTFLNVAAHLQTSLSPKELLVHTQQIENELGRAEKSKGNLYEDRPIDIDILLYDDLIRNTPELTIPHPLMHRRTFVLEPLAEIAGTLQHPTFQHTISELLHAIEGLPSKQSKQEAMSKRTAGNHMFSSPAIK